MKKRILCMVLTLSMVISLLPIGLQNVSAATVITSASELSNYLNTMKSGCSSNSGNTAYINCGAYTFLLTETLDIQTDTIILDMGSTTIRAANHSGIVPIRVTSGSLTIRNGFVYGAQGDAGRSAIDVDNSSALIIENCGVSSYAMQGAIRVNASTGNVTIRGGSIIGAGNCGHGINTADAEVTVDTGVYYHDTVQIIGASGGWGVRGSVRVMGNGKAIIKGADEVPGYLAGGGITKALTVTGTPEVSVSGGAWTTQKKEAVSWGITAENGIIRESDDGANYAVLANGQASTKRLITVSSLFDIAKNVGPNGTATIVVNNYYVTSAKPGSTVNITATPSSDAYVLDSITVNKTGDATTKVTVSSNSFTMPAYPVTVNVSFKKKAYTATVTAKKNNAAWTDAASEQIVLSTAAADSSAGRQTITPVSGVYTLDDIDPTTTYYVWAKNNAGNYVNKGSVSESSPTLVVDYYGVTLTTSTGIDTLTGGGTYVSGETATISATLLPGYTWSKWSDSDTTQTDRSITVDKEYDLTPSALAIPATAPAVSTTGATLTYGYTSGSISVTATPATGHTITGYQWFSCNNDGSNKTIVSEGTSATYSIPTEKNAGSYYYVCDVTTTRTDNNQTKTVTTSPATLVTVNKCPITVTMNDKNRNYGEANPAFDFAITSGSLQNSDTNTALAITGATTATPVSNADTYDITGTSTSANYEVTINQGTLTINQKTSQVTDFTYDLTAKTYNGNAQGITVAPKTGVGTITVKYNGSETVPTEPETYAITIDVSNATNYQDITNLSLGTYTINKADAPGVTLTSSKTPSTYEGEVTFTATVVKTGNGAMPTGNVTFTSGGTTVLATVALTDGVATLKKSDLPVPGNVIMAEYNGDSRYHGKISNGIPQSINRKPIKFTIENTEQFYESGMPRTIQIADTNSLLTQNEFAVSYYRVDENEGVLASTTPVKNAIAAGKYLFVIDFKNPQPNYQITNKFNVFTTALPNIANYENIGYLDIKAAQSGQQKPISFTNGAASVFVTDGTYKNILINENASNILYKSSNDTIAEAAADGTVTLKKAGTVTITATSTMANTTPVYASYVLTIGKKPVTITAQDDVCEFGNGWDKSTSVTYSDHLNAEDFTGSIDFDTKYTAGSKVGEYTITPTGLASEQYQITFVPAILTITPKTLTAGDFKVSVSDKPYDGTVGATVTASIISGIYSGNTVKSEVEGSFTSADANDNVAVNYTITGLTGKDGDNYVLDGGTISGNTTAKISPATVSVICASNTTRTFDGNPQSVDLSAMANGAVFDSSNYAVKYNGGDSPKDVGVYDITVVPNSSNYVVKPFGATLTIQAAAQEVFSIESVPDRVYYGDRFQVSTQDARGTVTYAVNEGAPAEIDNGGNFVATGIGTVKITATSTKEGYAPKTATKTVTVYPRVVTPAATATNRGYNGENGVDITVGLENVMAGDSITAAATGIMANADAGTHKMVYVSGIALDGAKKAFYTLGTTALQTTVTIEKAEITGFSISAQGKKYDGTTAANTEVTGIVGVYPGDLGQVGVTGGAVFDDETAGSGKRVTYTATGLTGAKAANYQFAEESAKIGTATADISPMNIQFIIGAATFKYDGEAKEVITSGVDELGRVVTDYTVEYWKDGALRNAPPKEAGDYTVRIALRDSVNYATAQGDVPMTIAQANQEQLTIVGLPSTIEYSDEFTLEAIGGSGSGQVTWSADHEDVVVGSDGTVKINGAVGEKVTITVTKKDDINFTEKSAEAVFMPTPKTTSFVLDDLRQEYSGDGKEVTVTPDISGATYDTTYNGSPALPTDAGTYNVVVKATGNYKGTANTTLTIGKAKMSGLGVSQAGCTYGDTLADATFDTAPSGVDVRVVYSTIDGKKPTKAGDYMVTATYTGDNYETFAASSEFQIEKKLLTVKANDKTRKYGDANPVFTLVFDGFVKDENESVLLSEPVATTVATVSSPVNEYEITVSGGRADNYSFGYDNSGKLKVTGAVGGNFYITGANNSVTAGDIFTLHAYYDNAKPAVSWQSSNDSIATVDPNGVVTILKKGDATITATITDANYEPGISATFQLNVSKKALQLKPADLVKVYNAERQDITLVSDDANFIPTLSGENPNIDITYTLTTDSSVTEPKQAGVYTVTYSINHPSYTGGETVTMYINKATVTVRAHDVTKVYGEENPGYYITGLIGADETNGDHIAKITEMFDMTSDGDSTGTKTNVGEYPITLAVKAGKTLQDDGNYNLVISDAKGKLTVTKAPLTVKVSDASRAYGGENPDPAYEYVGFVGGETENDLTAKTVFAYDPSVSSGSNVGTYPDVITASGATSDNYEISYTYTDGTGANLTIHKRPVTVSAGTVTSNYLTVHFDQGIAGLTKDHFSVMLSGTPVTITSVSPNRTNTAYLLNGSFQTDREYAVDVTAGDNYELGGLPLSITPKASGGGGGGGGGSVTASYKITVTQTEGGTISPDTVSVNKNDSKTFTITAHDGYEIQDVLVDGQSVGAVKTYTFDKVAASGAITATFQKIEQPTPTQQPTGWENPFADVGKTDWFYDGVKWANENGLMHGTSETLFAPNADITRAMFVTVLYRMEQEPNVDGAPFTDVESGGYDAKAVAWASANRIVKGISETEFAPNDHITREQMAAVIQRYAIFKGLDVATSKATSYADSADISDYAKEAVAFCTEHGMMNGKDSNLFAPLGYATRAEVAAVLERVLKALQ